jgi:sortase (surface protein transpeptidase)
VLAGAILLGAEFVSGAEHRQALPLMSAPSPAFGMVTSPGAPGVASAPGVAGATVTSANPSQQLLPNALPASPPAGTAIASVPAMTESAPLRVEIPAIGVNASVEALGENPDGTVKVPSLSTPRLTSWFDDGPAPGQNGPAAIYGHVATAATGPAVFYRLADLVAGDTVEVARADHSVAVFRVYQVSEYAKDDFPTLAVYGDTAGPELRLVTCGGAFDRAKGSYDDNVVVYARLIAADH